MSLCICPHVMTQKTTIEMKIQVFWEMTQCCGVGSPSISRDWSAFISRVKQSEYWSWLLDHEGQVNIMTLKSWELLARSHCVTFWKTLTLNNTPEWIHKNHKMWISSWIVKHNPVSTRKKTVVVFMFTNAVTKRPWIKPSSLIWTPVRLSPSVVRPFIDMNINSDNLCWRQVFVLVAQALGNWRGTQR